MDIKTVMLTTDKDRPLRGIRVTTEHSASSYGIPVLVVGGEPVGPGEQREEVAIPAGAHLAEEAVAALVKAGYRARLAYLDDPAALHEQYVAALAEVGQEWYGGWTIWDDVYGGNLFEVYEAERFDRKASTYRFAELYQAALEAAFPGADVRIEAHPDMAGASSRPRVHVPDSDDPEADRLAHDDAVEQIETIGAEVYGDAKWYVDRLYGVAEFAEACREALGWTASRFRVERARGHVPAPEREVAASPLWTHSQVEEFIARRRGEREQERREEAERAAARRESEKAEAAKVEGVLAASGLPRLTEDQERYLEDLAEQDEADLADDDASADRSEAELHDAATSGPTSPTPGE